MDLTPERIERIRGHMNSAFEHSGDSQGYCLDTALAESVDDLLQERKHHLKIIQYQCKSSQSTLPGTRISQRHLQWKAH